MKGDVLYIHTYIPHIHTHAYISSVMAFSGEEEKEEGEVHAWDLCWGGKPYKDFF